MPSQAAFRADLEGLRGVAVLAVVLFHAGVPGTSGGYVGVDVFFVLSGFLITGLLRDELVRDGRVRLLRFWARRARRLLPAALLVLATTAAAAALVLSPLRARAVFGDALAAAVYAGNHRFALASTDYLADTGAVSPLLHFWSLGVEEQFYVVWPLLLLLPVVAGRRAASGLLPVVLVVAVVSFAACVHLTAVAQPWAFFSLPTRAWELATGGAVAVLAPRLLAPRLHRTAAAVLGWAGAGSLGVAIVVLDEATAYPGTAALLPVLGTAALVAAGAVPPPHGPSRLLAHPLLRAAGRLSYSWYLWHWPVLVLAEEVAGPLSLVVRLALVGASAGLAAATLALLEDPVRHSASLARRPGLVLTGALACTATVAAALTVAPATLPTAEGAAAAAPVPTSVPTPGPTASATPTSDPFEAALRRALLAGTAVREVPRNLRPSLEDASDDEALPFTDGCHVRFLEVDLPPCAYGRTDAPTSVVLLGDSHATHWFPALHAAAEAHSWRLVAHGKHTCPPFGLAVQQPDLRRPYTECDAWQEAVLDKVGRERPDVVVLSVARHYGPEWGIHVHEEAWLQGMGSVVQRLRASGTRVLVLSATPWPRTSVPDCLAEHLDDATRCVFSRATGVSATGARAERAVVEQAGGTYVDVAPWLCTPVACPVVVGDVLVYRDDNHITTTWARTVAPLLTQRVVAALAEPA